MARASASPSLYPCDKKVYDWTKSDLEEGAKTILTCRRFIEKLCQSCVRKGDDDWAAEMQHFLLPQSVPLDGKTEPEGYMMLGRTDSEIAVLKLVVALHNLEHLPLMYNLCATAQTIASQWSDPRAQSLVGAIVKEQLA